MDDTKQWKQKFTKWISEGNRKLLLIPILLLLGCYLLLSGEDKENVQKNKNQEPTPDDIYAYEQSLENRLTDLLSCVSGAGKTRVMVTLESTQMNVYAVDVRDSMGGTEQKHILLDEGGALTESIQTPQIGGVAVLCEGGDNMQVVSQIHEILSSLLGLSTGRISVTKMN